MPYAIRRCHCHLESPSRLLPLLRAADKLTFEDRVELMRGLMAEYAKAKVLVPRSKKNLEINSDGTTTRRQWQTSPRKADRRRAWAT